MDKQNKWTLITSDPWWNYKRKRNKWEWVRIAVTQKYCIGKKVLEIGCGNGDLYSYIASFGTEIYGVDISPLAIRMAKAKCLELGLTGRFTCCDGSNIPLRDSIFDVLILPEIIEHVNDPIPILKEAKRLCKSGSRVIITVPNENLIPDADHKIIFTKNSLAKLAYEIFDSEVFFIDEIPSQWLGIYVTNNKKQMVNNDVTTDTVHDELNRFFSVINNEPIDMSEKVSVIIPTYNREKYIISSLESVLNQTHRNIEVIVVNDGSTDSTEKLLGPYFTKIKYIKQENAGKSAAINKGLDIATGDFIWVMDDDDIAHPMKLEMQIRVFKKNPHVGLISSEMIVLDGDNNDRVISYLESPSTDNKNKIFNLLLQGNIFYGPPVIVRHECYKKVGNWDTNLIRSVDYDMWLRIVREFDAMWIYFPTIFLRAHKGRRGSKTDNFSNSELKNKWKEYDNAIFRKVYEGFPLTMYFRQLENDPDNLLAQMIGLYERAFIMIAHDLYDLAFSDINMIRMYTERIKNMYLFPVSIEKYLGPIIERIHKLEFKAKDLGLKEIGCVNDEIKKEFLKSYNISFGRKTFNDFLKIGTFKRFVSWTYFLDGSLLKYIIWAFNKKIKHLLSVNLPKS